MDNNNFKKGDVVYTIRPHYDKYILNFEEYTLLEDNDPYLDECDAVYSWSYNKEDNVNIFVDDLISNYCYIRKEYGDYYDIHDVYNLLINSGIEISKDIRRRLTIIINDDLDKHQIEIDALKSLKNKIISKY